MQMNVYDYDDYDAFMYMPLSCGPAEKTIIC